MRVLIFLLLSFASFTSAQIHRPIKWKSSITRIDENNSQIRIVADIDSGWHIYGPDVQEGGPVPTQFSVKSIKGAKLNGGVKISGPDRFSGYDDTFEMNLEWFSSKMVFVQNLKTAHDSNLDVDVEVRYMCCNDESCLPPQTKSFVLHLDSIARDVQASAVIDGNTDKDDAPSLQVSKDISTCYVQSADGSWNSQNFQHYWFAENYTGVSVDKSSMPLSEKYGWKYILIIFLTGFGAGLLSIFTPCVWPVIPMTVGFFMKKKGGKRDAVFYGFSIFIIYVLLGVVVTVLFGADSLNVLATNAWVNLFLFVMMILFALSFIGLFEIELPASWSNALNKKAESRGGGVVSIMLMACVLVVVSFSCTGPIIGTLLVELATGKSILNPLIGMSGFALAIGLPFAFFAMFPQLMRSLPKSGSWMQTVKYTLAVIEILFALKFLSVADLTMGWNILPRWLMVLIWGLIGLTFSLYLLKRYFIDRKIVGNILARVLDLCICALSLLFSLYMFSGFLGNNLEHFSAFLPPAETEMEIYTDLDSAYSVAAVKNKPVFIDFTGWGCVNCRKMEGKVMADSRVKSYLDKFVIVRLYVDERTQLPSRLKVYENGDYVELETVGDKWSWFERTRWNANTQPLYVLTDEYGNMLTSVYSYNENIGDFVTWIETGYRNFTDK